MFASTLMPSLCFQTIGTWMDSITLDSTIDDTEPLSAQNEDPYNAQRLSASFVPSTTQWMTEQETIRQSVQERQPHQRKVAPPTVSWPVLLTLLLHDRLLSLSGTTFWCTQMADLPDTLVFATLPSTQRCAGGHYSQAGSVSASTHMMPSSFSSIVLTWLLFISTIIVTSITSTETQRTCSLRLAPPMPCIRLVMKKFALSRAVLSDYE